jgi:hypothetical protein
VDHVELADTRDAIGLVFDPAVDRPHGGARCNIKISVSKDRALTAHGHKFDFIVDLCERSSLMFFVPLDSHFTGL